MTDKEQLAYLELLNHQEHDKGAFPVHPHNKAEWGDFLVFKRLVKKGIAVVEYNDAACVAGWVAEFYLKEYFEQVSQTTSNRN